VTDTLAVGSVGLNEVGDGLWGIHFGPVLLGRMDESTGARTLHQGCETIVEFILPRGNYED
jgi:hypothetical protein